MDPFDYFKFQILLALALASLVLAERTGKVVSCSG
jgi:hypothetical protein